MTIIKEGAPRDGMLKFLLKSILFNLVISLKRLVWLVIYERCNVSQSGSKFSKTEGIKILRKSVMVKFAGIHKIGIQ